MDIARRFGLYILVWGSALHRLRLCTITCKNRLGDDDLEHLNTTRFILTSGPARLVSYVLFLFIFSVLKEMFVFNYETTLIDATLPLIWAMR